MQPTGPKFISDEDLARSLQNEEHWNAGTSAPSYDPLLRLSMLGGTASGQDVACVGTGFIPDQSIDEMTARIQALGFANPPPSSTLPKLERTYRIDTTNHEAIKREFLALREKGEHRAYISQCLRKLTLPPTSINTHEDFKAYAKKFKELPNYKAETEIKIAARVFLPGNAMKYYFAKLANGEKAIDCIFMLMMVLHLKMKHFGLKEAPLKRQWAEALQSLPADLADTVTVKTIEFAMDEAPDYKDYKALAQLLFS